MTLKESERKRGTHFLESIGGSSQGQRMTVNELGALTNWGEQKKGQLRTVKGSERAIDTHFLETPDGRTTQDNERR